MATVKALLEASPLPRLESRMLLQQALGVSRAWLVAHDTDELPEAAVQAYLQAQAQREQGEPIAYLLGEREFMGHAFQVGPGVLIPRPETELLVEQALTVLDELAHPAPRVLDLGTGSGAIAISIALARPDAVVVATDASSEALGLAQRNAQALGARVVFYQGDWYGAVPDAPRSFDLIVSNPPYIAAQDPHLSQGDLRFEPAMALTDGADGLSAIRLIVAQAPAYLATGGQLWLEHGYDQAPAVRSLLIEAGFSAVRSLPDLAGIPRSTGGHIMGDS
ncbi:peptide chain release factor N(5)-glutamine methyltransferase [Pusillimonas sp. CC-YST705]|uniref:Release factor glutamine methyltransferase n=1 Tax=Mesopusillimonas faecipullorum TaxID=2755040 RepID=A0ABS8CCH6_9BURK|nr:peptide chain release factor N(5)-glutamine methyltransferase [Mesopusillimonas faecipullorum]MCB5363740.1 peptide chain release factor N(5)-glutamine methyltransferase [Mesopusillimonas faecipullorum]